MQLIDDVPIENANPTTGDGAHCEFRLLGKSELSYQQNVERRVELQSDRVGNGDATAWQRKHDEVRLAAVGGQEPRKDMTSIVAVTKAH